MVLACGILIALLYRYQYQNCAIQVQQKVDVQPQTAESAQPVFEALDADARRQLDALCGTMTGNVSVWLLDVDSGREYTYNGQESYYVASLLKLPYALWLCRQEDSGLLSLDTPLPNLFYGMLEDSALAAYNEAQTIPARAAIRAMVAHSDNNAVMLLAAQWSEREAEFVEYLHSLGFVNWEYFGVSGGSQGYCSVSDFSAALQDLYDYLESDAPNVRFLRSCFVSADHNILYVPEGVTAAKKYGSWDSAYHDAVIVYGERPYLLCCMSDQGSEAVDFPPAATSEMQKLGRLVWELLEPDADPLLAG